MGAPDSRGRTLLFPKNLPKLPVIVGGADHERKRKIAVKCLELEEMLEKQGQSQSEIETKVASFRSLLLRQLTTLNNNKVRSVNIHQREDETEVEAEDDTEEEREEEREGIR